MGNVQRGKEWEAWNKREIVNNLAGGRYQTFARDEDEAELKNL